MCVEGDPPNKHSTKLCFCPFCQYSITNDQSFLDHVMRAHYQANYGCRKCLGEVCGESQPMECHLQECKGLPDAAKSDSPCDKKASSAAKKAAHKQSHSLRCPESTAPEAIPGTCHKDAPRGKTKSSEHHRCWEKKSNTHCSE